MLRKISLLGLALVIPMMSLIPAMAFQSIDYTCLNRCTNNGYSYGYCQSMCTYETFQPIKQIDYTCLNRCTSAGYMYSYCQQVCSY